MSTYAKINFNNIVEDVIICDDSNVTLLDGTYIKVTDSTNIPVQGLLYDKEKNKFETIKPYDSWLLKEDLTWESPAGPKPEGPHRWNEDSQEWVSF